MTRRCEGTVFGLVILALFSCGKSSSGGGGGTGSPSEVETKKDAATQGNAPGAASYYFAAKSDLPSCTEALAQSLAFVASEKQFYVCSEKTWSEVDVGGGSAGSVIKIDDIAAGSVCQSGGKAIKTGIDDNENGVLDKSEIDDTQNICNGNSATDVDPFSVTETYIALGDGTNLCTSYAPDEDCYFEAGEVEVFANGNWQVSLIFRHTYFYSSGSDSDMDTTNQDLSFIMGNGEDTGMIKRLDPFVSRNDGTGVTLWALIFKEKQNVVLVHDTNGNFEVDVTDLVVGTYPLVKNE